MVIYINVVKKYTTCTSFSVYLCLNNAVVFRDCSVVVIFCFGFGRREVHNSAVIHQPGQG